MGAFWNRFGGLRVEFLEWVRLGIVQGHFGAPWAGNGAGVGDGRVFGSLWWPEKYSVLGWMHFGILLDQFGDLQDWSIVFGALPGLNHLLLQGGWFSQSWTETTCRSKVEAAPKLSDLHLCRGFLSIVNVSR